MSLDLAFLKRMPKADLHVHIDGSVRTTTIIDLARRQGASLPTTDPEALSEMVSVGPECTSLMDFLKTFDVFYPLLKNPDGLERIAMELAMDEATDGVRYVEARFAPVLQATESFPIEEAVRAALKGLNAGARASGIECGLVLCAYRSEPPEASAETVEAALKFRDEGVVGVDLAGDEKNFPALPHLEPFVKAREASLPVTIHAGEVGPVSNIQEALFVFGARRLGHAVRLPEDPELMAHVAGEGIPIEVCLTSNIQTGAVRALFDHPVQAFLKAGIPVVLNTDDPAVCRTSLSREFALAAETFGLGVDEIRRIAGGGFEAAFLPEEARRRLRDEFERWFDERDG